MSSVLQPLIGGRSTDPGHRIIDGLVIIATLFGTAASLAIGARQIGQGFQLVTGWSENANTVALVIIGLLTIGTILSAVSGVAKGVRWLSNINMALAIALAVFIFVVDPTVFLANVIPGVLAIPSTIIILAFAVMGGTSIWLQRSASLVDASGATTGVADPAAAIAPDCTVDSLPPAPEIFFRMIEHFLGHDLIIPVVMVMLAIFFITTADSASLVNSQLSQGGNPSPRRLVTAFWALCMAGTAMVILLAGGQNALQGLQNLVTITELPFAVVLIAMCAALVREMRTDPLMIRAQYAETAVENAVHHGVQEHGDDFHLAIEPSMEETSEFATGAYTDDDEHADGEDAEVKPAPRGSSAAE